MSETTKLNMVREYWLHSDAGLRDEFARMHEGFRFYTGDQWDAVDMKKLQDEKQPGIVMCFFEDFFGKVVLFLFGSLFGEFIVDLDRGSDKRLPVGKLDLADFVEIREKAVRIFQIIAEILGDRLES